jgi:hypothetical protein
MAYKDTLTLYEELVSTGTPVEQAKILAHQQGGLVEEMGSIEITLKQIEKDLFWMRSIGAGLMAAYIANLGAIIGLIVLMK